MKTQMRILIALLLTVPDAKQIMTNWSGRPFILIGRAKSTFLCYVQNVHKQGTDLARGYKYPDSLRGQGPEGNLDFVNI